MGIVQTSFRICAVFFSDDRGGRGDAFSVSSFAVHMKSHSSFFMLSSRLTVLYHIDKPPRLPLLSPPSPVVDVLPVSRSAPDRMPTPPTPPRLVKYVSRNVSPAMSQTRSQGRSRKSDLMISCTCGSDSKSAVGVVCSRCSGARRSGLGDGNEVRCGFWASAAAMVDFDVGGVMRVMSVTPIR